MTPPITGQIYERDGLQREVVDVNAFAMVWRDVNHRAHKSACLLSAWYDWASKATLVKPNAKETP